MDVASKSNARGYERTAAGTKIIQVQYQEPLNLLTVRGSSMGDYSTHKYELINRHIVNHFKTRNSLHLYFNYDFLDNSALAYLATIMSTLNDYHDRGKQIRLFWSCVSTADNMNDEGQKLKSLCRFTFNS